MVDILRVPANGNGGTLINTRVNGKDSPEGVRCDLMAGQSPLRTRLKGAVITPRRWIKRVNGAQDRVDIFGASAVVLVDICKDVLTVPVALQEAEDLRSLRYAASTCLTNLSSKGISLYQSTMLDCCSEER